MIKDKNIEKKIKVALVTYSLSAGGLERVVSNLSFVFDEMGLDVHLYVLRSDIDYPLKGTLHKYDIDKYRGFAKLRQYLKLRKSINRNQFDFIIDHRYRLNSISEFFWQRFIYFNQKVINYIHSSKIRSYLFSKSWTNQLIFRKRPFICVSKGIEEKVNSDFPFLRTRTVYNPISVLQLENYPISENPFILAVARMDKTNVKQIDVLLECFEKSELPEKNYKLIIIGSGERKREMEKLATKLNIDDKVLFKGFLKNPYLYFKQASFVVLTSKSEGLPTVLIESLMLGTPVVSFNCETGPNEIITNEENGLLVENQNKTAFIEAMNRMTQDKDLYLKLKLNSDKSVEKFSNRDIKSQWQKFISEELLNDKH